VSKILHSNMKENNYSLILRAIFINKSIERVNLVKETLLSPSTVTRCVSKLVKTGIVIEKGTSSENRVGRKAITLEMNPEAFKVLLVDIGASKTNYAIGFLNGSLNKIKAIETPKKFEEVLENVYELLKDYKDIEFVSFSIPGMVDVDNNEILFVPSRGWRNIKINVPGKRIFADNEANLAMITEAFQNENIRNSKCSVFVTVREGFGTGLWINGEIFRGPSFSAGEFGHTIIDIKSNEICHCGNRGCVEQYTSLSKYFGKNFELKKYLKGSSIKKDSKLKEYTEILSKALVNIVNSLNPEYIIVGGELSGLPRTFYEEIEDLVKKSSLEHASKILKILPPTFTNDTYLYGAFYATIENFFIPEIIESIK